MQYVSGAMHTNLSNTNWEAAPIFTYFNSQIEIQTDIFDLIEAIPPQSVNPGSTERLLAVLPIYAGTGDLRQQTGKFCMGVTRETPYRYVFRCYVTNMSGTELGTFGGQSTIEYQSGGVYTGSERKAYLAYCAWSDGLGHNYVSMYANVAQKALEPYAGEYASYWAAGGGAFEMSDIYNLFGIHGDDNGVPIEYDPDLGPASEEGGYGPDGGNPIGGIGGPGPTFDYTSDDISLDPLPPGVSGLGFVNIYKCSIGALTALGDTLFPDVAASTDVWGAVVALSDAIWNSKLIDYVISIHMIPGDVQAGNPEDIKIGTRTLTGIQGAKVSGDYMEIDLGSLKIDELYTGFADYHTRCRLFLPFYGFIEIKPEYWQSATLNVTYRINVVDGSFIAVVKSTINRHQPRMSSIVGQYSGCACIHCPASGVSYASMFGGMVSNGAGMGISMASGNVAGVASSAINVAAASQGSMEHSNPYNASASIMGHKTPFLLIERPVSQFPTGYAKEEGFPLWVTKRIGDCHGLTICENAVLNFGCTDEIGKEIIAALKEGVIL